MSGWYTTRDTSTWFEASDAQAWNPSAQNVSTGSTIKYSPYTINPHLDAFTNNKTGKSEFGNNEAKIEKHRSVTIPTYTTEKYFELSSPTVSDQNAWNNYVLSNTSDDFNSGWDVPAPTTGVQTMPSVKPEKVAFSRLKRNVDIEEELTKQNLYKTESCQSWIVTGTCRYGVKCQYAHGKDELRTVLRHPKYKTEVCKTFSTTGQCAYGKRCRFVHQLNELRTDQEAAEDISQLEMKLQEISLSLSPDPVFPASGLSQVAVSAETRNPVPVKKGSRLPFLQKLRKL